MNQESNVQTETNNIEINNYSGEEVNDETSSQTSSSTSTTSNIQLLGASTALIAAVSTIVIVIMSIVSGVSNYSASFNSIEVYGESFSYDLDVSFEYQLDEYGYIDFYEVDTGLRLIIANSSTSNFITLEATKLDENCTVDIINYDDNSYSLKYNFKGIVDSLECGTMYQLEIVGEEDGKTIVYASEEIKTLDGAITRFDSVTFECTCLINNTANFQINFIDEQNFYSDFRYSFIRNSDGSTPTIDDVSISNPHDIQYITNISELQGSDYILIITYMSSAYTDTFDASSNTQVKITYEINVQI